ncbi:MAG: shikimate kinase [Pseudomonadota bacterium]
MRQSEQSTAEPTAPTSLYELKKTVVMVGMMGAGKTAVGRALAAKLRVPFMDSDAEIERAADRSIPEIFDRDGEAFFRQREAEVIERLLKNNSGVLSTGGGAFLFERNRKTISTYGVSIWLNADLELLWQRVRHRDTRPLLQTPDPKTTLTEIFHARVPIYRKTDLSVLCQPQLSVEETADRVIDTLKTRKDVLRVSDA